MIGRIITASTTPTVNRPSPLYVGPLKNRRTGTSGMWFAQMGATRWARNGPSVKMPHRPNTTLGTPASTSRQNPTTFDRRGGSFSTTTRAVPTPTGTANTRAMADDTRVPTMSGSAPYEARGGWVMPFVVTSGE